MTTASQDNSDRMAPWRGVLLSVVVASGVFTVAVLIVLAANSLAAQAADPLEPSTVAELRELLREQPRNERLRETIRDIDRNSRQQFFYHQAVRTTGVKLALGGAVVLLTGLHLLTCRGGGDESVPEALPSEEKRRSEQRRSLLLAVGTAGVILVALALLPVGLNPPSPRGDLAARPTPDANTPTNPQAPSGDSAATNVASPAAPLPSQPVHWPAFRGPGGLGVADAENPPTAWDGKSGRNILWKTPVPRPGYSSPIVVGDNVYLTGGDKEKREIFCFNADTGQLRWRADTEGVPDAPGELPSVTEDTGYAAPTMTSDGARVFAIFATGNILGLDLAGNRLWARNLGVPENHYAHSSSLLMVDGKLIVQFDHFGGSRLLALNPASGETVYETERFEVGISWSSPVHIPVGDEGQIILCGDPSVAAYKPSDGSLLWSSDVLSGEIGVSPAYADGVVYEGNEFAVLAALQAAPADEREPGDVLWEVYENLPNVSSPVVVKSRLYMGNSYGTIACVKTADGTTVWTEETDAGFYASPILAGAAVYFVDMKGVTTIIEPADTFKQLHRNALGESVVSTPAFADGRIYLRGRKNLYAISNQ